MFFLFGNKSPLSFYSYYSVVSDELRVPSVSTFRRAKKKAFCLQGEDLNIHLESIPSYATPGYSVSGTQDDIPRVIIETLSLADNHLKLVE